jgi:hypothetical protein
VLKLPLYCGNSQNVVRILGMNMNVQALHTKCFNVCAYGTFIHVQKNCMIDNDHKIVLSTQDVNCPKCRTSHQWHDAIKSQLTCIWDVATRKQVREARIGHSDKILKALLLYRPNGVIPFSQLLLLLELILIVIMNKKKSTEDTDLLNFLIP